MSPVLTLLREVMSWSHIRVNRLSTYIRYLRLMHTLLAFFLDQSFPCAKLFEGVLLQKVPLYYQNDMWRQNGKKRDIQNTHRSIFQKHFFEGHEVCKAHQHL